MNNRWLGANRELQFTSARPDEPAASRGSDVRASPEPRLPKEEAFWRSWLATGVRRVPIDRRRARGADAHLKKILVGGSSGVVDFSSAMARQAMDEALHELPPQHNQVLKLAYFAGLTNREIADEVGMSVSEVRKTLRGSLASVGAHLDRGRAKGRRAIQDLAMLPWWRTFGETVHRMPLPAVDHVLQTGIVAVMTAAAVALLVTHQAPAPVAHTHKTLPTAVQAAGSTAPQAHLPPLVPAQGPHSAIQPVVDDLRQSGSLPASTGAIAVPLPLPTSVATPSVLPKLRVHGIHQLPFGA